MWRVSVGGSRYHPRAGLLYKRIAVVPQNEKINKQKGVCFLKRKIKAGQLKKLANRPTQLNRKLKVNHGKTSRTKGHSFERLIAIKLRDIFPDCRRHLEYQDAECNGVDLVNTGPYRIQCKRGKKPASFSAIKEVTADEALGDVPVLITQGDRERILVAIPLEEFIRLIANNC